MEQFMKYVVVFFLGLMIGGDIAAALVSDAWEQVYRKHLKEKR